MNLMSLHYRLAAVDIPTGPFKHHRRTLPYCMPRWCLRLVAGRTLPMESGLSTPCPRHSAG